MAAKSLSDLTELLMRYTKKPLTPLAVIEQATTENQRVHISNLKNCAVDFEEKQFSSPSLVILGDVVKLHDDFKWFTSEKTGSVFNELTIVK